jgi:hypothetical protein
MVERGAIYHRYNPTKYAWYYLHVNWCTANYEEVVKQLGIKITLWSVRFEWF